MRSRRKSARPSTGSYAFKTRTAAGAKTARAISSTIVGTSLQLARRHRPRGPCSGSWPVARSIIRRLRAEFVICWKRKPRMVSGTKSASPRPGSRASFTCATMDTENFFHYGRSRDIGISRLSRIVAGFSACRGLREINGRWVQVALSVRYRVCCKSRRMRSAPSLRRNS